MTAQNIGAMKATIGLDVSQFESGAKSAGRTLKQFSDSVSRSFAAAKAAASGASSFDELRASIDPAFAATQKYAAIQRELAGMVESGAVSQRAANLVLEQAAAKYMGVETAAEQTARAQRASSAAVDAATRGYTALRAQVDPLYAASKRYEQALETLNAAQAAGVISDQERARTLKLLDAQMISADRATAVATQGVGRFAPAITNASFQVQDFAVQVASGQSALMAFSQQAPQLLGAFGFTGKLALWGAAAGTVVAVLAALAPVLMKTGDAAKSADDAMSDLRDSASALNDTTSLLTMSATELAEKYGRYAGQVREAARALSVLQVAQAKADLGSAIASASDALDQFAGKANTAFSSGITTAQAIVNIRDALKVTGPEAVGLAGAFDQLKRAVGFEAQVAALTEVDRLLAAAGASADDLPGPLRLALIEARNAQIAMADLAASAEDADRAARSLASVNMSENISAAAGQAQLLASQFGIALALAQQLAGVSTKKPVGGDRGLGFGLPGVEDPVIGGSTGLGFGDNPGSGSRDPVFNPYVPPVITAERGGGGGGGEKPEKDPTEDLFRSTEEQIAKLRLETSLLGRVSEEASKAKIEFDLLADAKRKGIEVTDSLSARITAEAEELAKVQAAYDAARMHMEFMNEMSDTLKDGLSNAFGQIVTGAEDAEDALRNLAASLLSMAANRLIGSAFDQVFASIGFANGGVFSGGNVVPFARGGVVTSPTLFPMRNGTGLMGEAGPEAIMPLTRGSDGKLGVKAPGGAAGGRSEVVVTLSPELEGRILKQAEGQSIAITQAGVAQLDKALPIRFDQIAKSPRRR